jgi:hypothetical protein
MWGNQLLSNCGASVAEFPADVEHNLAHDHIAANHRDVVSP